MFTDCSVFAHQIINWYFQFFNLSLKDEQSIFQSFSKIVPKPLVGNKSMVMLASSQRPINDTILFGILACQKSDKLEIKIWTTIHKSIYLLWLQMELPLLDQSLIWFQNENVPPDFAKRSQKTFFRVSSHYYILKWSWKWKRETFTLGTCRVLASYSNPEQIKHKLCEPRGSIVSNFSAVCLPEGRGWK